MFRVVLAFAVGYCYCEIEHHGISGAGVGAATVGLGLIMVRLMAQAILQPVAVKVYRNARAGKLRQWLTPVNYWLHHFNRHEEFDYQSCIQCHQ